MNLDEIKSALKNVEDYIEAIKTLRNLAEQVLEAKGWPEKKMHSSKCIEWFEVKNFPCICGADYYNSALDACILAHQAEKARILEELSEEYIGNFIYKWWIELEGLNGLSPEEESQISKDFYADMEDRSYKLAQAIHKMVKGVINGQ